MGRTLSAPILRVCLLFLWFLFLPFLTWRKEHSREVARVLAMTSKTTNVGQLIEEMGKNLERNKVKLFVGLRGVDNATIILRMEHFQSVMLKVYQLSKEVVLWDTELVSGRDYVVEIKQPHFVPVRYRFRPVRDPWTHGTRKSTTRWWTFVASKSGITAAGSRPDELSDIVVELIQRHSNNDEISRVVHSTNPN